MSTARERMMEVAGEMAAKCKNCLFCQKECAFLKEYGMPGQIDARLLEEDNPEDPAIALQCSLCTLCTSVCPVRGLEPAALFQAMRECAMEENPSLAKRFKPLLAYETTGLSRPFTFFGLPKGTRRVLFPGCNLPGTRPDAVWACYEKLAEEDETLGLVFSCCAKPSRMAGLAGRHEERMSALVARLAEAGVEELVSMCPNCHMTLKDADTPFTVRSVYELLAETVREPEGGFEERVRTGVHDPCVLRGERSLHEAARTLLWNTGSSVAEMRHSMHKALCCGEGGGVALTRPEFAEAWRAKRKEEATERRVATYCAGCALGLKNTVDPVHLLDLALGLQAEPASRWPGGPKAYLNRIALKRKAAAHFRKLG